MERKKGKREKERKKKEGETVVEMGKVKKSCKVK